MVLATRLRNLLSRILMNMNLFMTESKSFWITTKKDNIRI
nr:MAG TPA: hypothetical protein [Caudoviricetes sp.]